MSAEHLPLLSVDALRALAVTERSGRCGVCSSLACAGWDSVPGTFDVSSLQRVGTLRNADIDEPTLNEHHPRGTHAWSADAPIAPAFYPYNRCDVWVCRACTRLFLRYTEYGGYYEDQRIRQVSVALIDDAQP